MSNMFCNSKKKGFVILVSCSIALIAGYFILLLLARVISTQLIYKDALLYMSNNRYNEAIVLLEKLDVYKDCQELVQECNYQIAQEYLCSEKYNEALAVLYELEDYKDVGALILECKYESALDDYANARYYEAKEGFDEIIGYKDSKDRIALCNQCIADTLFEANNLYDYINFCDENDLKTHAQYIESCLNYAEGLAIQCQFDEAIDYLSRVQEYDNIQPIVDKYMRAKAFFNEFGTLKNYAITKIEPIVAGYFDNVSIEEDSDGHIHVKFSDNDSYIDRYVEESLIDRRKHQNFWDDMCSQNNELSVNLNKKIAIAGYPFEDHLYVDFVDDNDVDNIYISSVNGKLSYFFLK